MALLTINQSKLPCDAFNRDGWRYTQTDITQKKMGGTDTRPHTKPVKINTDTNDFNEIIVQLIPTPEYQTENGYKGVLEIGL